MAEYDIMGKKVLCIPGAYSVDKWYRLQNDFKWFAQEQLSEEEMRYAEKLVAGKYYDFVFSHTCPYPWMPFDKFLPTIDQNKVDNSMEFWLEDFSHKVSYNLWIFGHFHDDRVINYFSQMVSEEIYDLNKLFKKFKRKQKRLSR